MFAAVTARRRLLPDTAPVRDWGGGLRQSGKFSPVKQPVKPERGDKELLKYLMVGIGGGLGSIVRFWLGSYIGSKMGTRFPYGTFVINVTGSFLIGLIFALLTVRTQWNPNWRYLIPIGFIGGYTTFSSFEFETLRTVQDGQIGLGLLYVGASVIVGFVAVWGGMIAGRAIS